MSKPLSHDQLLTIIDAVCSGTADEPQWQALDEHLANHPDDRAIYVDYFEFATELYWLVGRNRDAETTPYLPGLPLPTDAWSDASALMIGDRREGAITPIIPPLTGVASSNAFRSFTFDWPIAYFAATVIMAIVLSIASVTHVSEPASLERRTAANLPMANPKVAIVGQISGMADCVWEKGARPSRQKNVSSPLCVGDTLALRSGLLEITYDTGAKVLLQGPVTYEVESASGGYLSIGKLTAKLEKEERRAKDEELAASRSVFSVSHSPARLFSVRTPTAIVTDLGTEFGVEVSREGKTTSYVFRGVVEVQPITAHGTKVSQAVRLTANESVRTERAESDEKVTVQRVPVNPAAFVHVGQIQAASKEIQLESLRRWQAYCEKIRRDPSLVVHYDFQRDKDAPKVLHAWPKGGDKLDGVIHDAVWTTGRMPGKDALRFDGDGARVEVRIPKELKELTLAAWLSVALIDESGCCLLAADWRGDVSHHGAWQIYREGLFRFGTPTFDTETPALFVWQEWGNHRWRHLVVTACPAKEQIAYYLDGKRLFVGKLTSDFWATFNEANIGNWWSNHDRYERGMHGRMDDLFIFSRALSDSEITEMYEAGKKPSPP
jgi:hypothetical protein